MSGPLGCGHREFRRKLETHWLTQWLANYGLRPDPATAQVSTAFLGHSRPLLLPIIYGCSYANTMTKGPHTKNIGTIWSSLGKCADTHPNPRTLLLLNYRTTQRFR